MLDVESQLLRRPGAYGGSTFSRLSLLWRQRLSLWLVVAVAAFAVLDVFLLVVYPRLEWHTRPHRYEYPNPNDYDKSEWVVPGRAGQAGQAGQAAGHARLSHLVMVAGHSIYVGGSEGKMSRQDAQDESHWFLEAAQKDQLPLFLGHIETGVRLAAQDERMLLLFSGGQTREAAGRHSEADSYYRVAAEAYTWWNMTEVSPSLAGRVDKESYARDSFENVLFSICRFRQLVGQYPSEITIVSFPFKEYRFSHLHREALRFPASRFHFAHDHADQGEIPVPDGELNGPRKQFETDPYGCKPPLSTKKQGRDPFGLKHDYAETCPEMRDLFTYCGSSLYSGSLPWLNL